MKFWIKKHKFHKFTSVNDNKRPRQNQTSDLLIKDEHSQVLLEHLKGRKWMSTKLYISAQQNLHCIQNYA